MAVSRNRRKNGKVSKSFIGNSTGVRAINGNPSISDGKFKSNQKAVQNLIDIMDRFYNSNKAFLSDVPYLRGLVVNSVGTKLENPIMKQIMNRIANSKLALTQANIDKTGTAMFPIDCGYWVIGAFGSIWLDVEIDDVVYRVAFYNEKPYPTINVKCLSIDFSENELKSMIGL